MAGQRELSNGALLSPVPGRDSTWEQAHTREHLRDVHKGALAGQAIPKIPVLAEIEFRTVASHGFIGTAAEHHRGMVRDVNGNALLRRAAIYTPWFTLLRACPPVDPKRFPVRAAHFNVAGCEDQFGMLLERFQLVAGGARGP